MVREMKKGSEGGRGYWRKAGREGGKGRRKGRIKGGREVEIE